MVAGLLLPVLDVSRTGVREFDRVVEIIFVMIVIFIQTRDGFEDREAISMWRNGAGVGL
jgi:hypothetical protein